MGVITEFTTPRSTFAVGRALGDDPGLTVELERVVPTDETMIPFFWVWGDGLDAFESRLRAEPGIDAVRVVAEADGGRLYRVDWGNDMSSVVRELFDLEFTLLAGDADADGWRFEIRFDGADEASRFKRYLTEHGIPHELTRVSGLAGVDTPSVAGLTEKQRDALLTAYDGGFFEEPRELSTAELADRLDIAPSSASGRLKRATQRLIESAVIAEGAGRDPDRARPTRRGS